MGANGVLLYAESELSGLEELVWLDLASGNVTPALNQRLADFSFPRLSPDGTRVVAMTRTPETGNAIVVADLLRHTHSRIAERAHIGSRPTWRDNRTVVYGIDAGHGDRLAMRRADASTPQVELFRGMQPSVSAGRLVFVRIESGVGGGLWHTALAPNDEAMPPEPTPLQQPTAHEWQPALSPDGSLLAFTS